MKEIYVYLSSATCQHIYPDNSASSFRVKLPHTLHLDGVRGSWSMAITDLTMPKLTDKYKPNHINIQSLTCVPAMCEEGYRPIVQKLYFNEYRRGFPIRIDNPRYVQLNTCVLDTIDLYLTDDKSEAPSFKEGPLTCTLHIVCRENHN